MSLPPLAPWEGQVYDTVGEAFAAFAAIAFSDAQYCFSNGRPPPTITLESWNGFRAILSDTGGLQANRWWVALELPDTEQMQALRLLGESGLQTAQFYSESNRLTITYTFAQLQTWWEDLVIGTLELIIADWTTAAVESSVTKTSDVVAGVIRRLTRVVVVDTGSQMLTITPTLSLSFFASSGVPQESLFVAPSQPVGQTVVGGSVDLSGVERQLSDIAAGDTYIDVNHQQAAASIKGGTSR